MQAIPITYQGIEFRSKLECRHYIFMKKIGWNVEYEPEVEDVYGYQPDFELFCEGGLGTGCSHAADRYFIEAKHNLIDESSMHVFYLNVPCSLELDYEFQYQSE